MGLPLEGIRILDLTMVFAGPIAVKMLAELGAEAVKVESHYRMDMPCRKLCYPENNPGDEPWNRGGYFHYLNTSKLGITLALHKPEGIEIFRRLVKISDVVIENFSPRVMRNFGLQYEALREIKPDIIMASISGFGQSGRYRDRAAYAYVVEAASGLTSISGNTGAPMMSGTGYADWVMGMYAASAVLLALHHRKRTGRGQYIDVSGLEGIIFLIGEAIMDYTMNGRIKTPLGNRHPFMAPHGCYRCQGEDRWVAIAISTDEEWRRFCDTIGNPVWTQEERFSNAIVRWKNQDDLDRFVETWTGENDRDEIVRLLLEAKVCVAPVLNAKEILMDKELNKRGFIQTIDHPRAGRRPMPRQLSARFGSGWKAPERPAPLLGEHNRLILGKYLGMSEDEIEELERKDIIGTAPPKKYQDVKERGLNVKVFKRYNAIAEPESDYLEQLRTRGQESKP